MKSHVLRATCVLNPVPLCVAGGFFFLFLFADCQGADFISLQRCSQGSWHAHRTTDRDLLTSAPPLPLPLLRMVFHCMVCISCSWDVVHLRGHLCEIILPSLSDGRLQSSLLKQLGMQVRHLEVRHREAASLCTAAKQHQPC